MQPNRLEKSWITFFLTTEAGTSQLNMRAINQRKRLSGHLWIS
jgi:hypothetical protein